VKHDVIVARVDPGDVVKGAWHVLGNEHPAGHAKMDDQGFTRGKVSEQVFRAAAQALYSLTSQPFDHARRKGKAQTLSADFDPAHAAPFHDRLKAAADGFDLGQFGHDFSPRRKGALYRPARAI